MYEGGPLVWEFNCSPDVRPLNAFRFALALGDGERFWLSPEPGIALNGTPVPTYAYDVGTGEVYPLESPNPAATADADLMLGFYNWGHHWMDKDGACYDVYDDFRGENEKFRHCNVPFIAIWNGTDANMSGHNLVPSGRYVVEVYIKDPDVGQTLIAVNDVRPDSDSIDWFSCDIPSYSHGGGRTCKGTLDPEIIVDHPWPDRDGNRARGE
ncbi:MAG: hypothetical protein KY455_12615 [Euryarchaeota archaeon]|nr:hypothetical protein [Euryarchaeota archaeon]